MADVVLYCDADEKVLGVAVIVVMRRIAVVYTTFKLTGVTILIVNTDHFCTPSPTIRSTRKSGGQIWAEGDITLRVRHTSHVANKDEVAPCSMYVQVRGEHCWTLYLLILLYCSRVSIY